jgi:hypothetical protein
MHDESLIVSCVLGFNIPNLTESQLVIVKQDKRRIESEVVFNNPCFIESQPESLITTGGVTGVIDSFFEQEYIIENKENIKMSFLIVRILKDNLIFILYKPR